jgi:hypothetical protein
MRALALVLLLAACKGGDPVPAVPDADRNDAPTDVSTACLDPDGTPPNCFDPTLCEPVEDADFLNGCTGGQCIAFDNTARLPLFNNGNLPPLP